MQIASIISFCSHDFRFLDRCLCGISPFSSQILVTVCDHLFSGKEENYALLEYVYRSHPKIQFIEFAYDESLYFHGSMLCSQDPKARHLWHNTGRFISSFFLDKQIDWVCYFDADEIADPVKLSKWLFCHNLEEYSAVRFSSYVYFRKACYQAIQTKWAALLIQKKELKSSLFTNLEERMGMFNQMASPKILGQPVPLMHHYSWVKTKEELLQKVQSWGHFWERPWESIIEEEFSRPFQGSDFIEGLEYRTVDPFFDPLRVKVPTFSLVSKSEHFENVKLLDNVNLINRKEILKKELFLEFDLLS